MKPDSTMLALSSVGSLLGVLSLFGLYGSPIEFALWAFWGLALWVPVVVVRGAPRPVLALLLVGGLAGFQTGLIQGLFAQVLVENNSAVYGTSSDIGARSILFGTALAAGGAQGLVTGLIAAGINWARARRAAAAAS